MMYTNGRKRIGLALSGGVARGAVHVGVFSVLEREGIPIDFVAGTSAGALVGAAYCAGLTTSQLQKLTIQTGWRTLASLRPARQGMISFAKMEPWIIDLIGDVDIRDLAIPFAAVATDVDTGESVVLREGAVATAVRASCSVPGVIAPVRVQGRLLCDGGISDNLPIGVARQMGADYVIAVDLFMPGYMKNFGPLGVGVLAIETLVRKSGGGMTGADCLIQPELAGYSYLNFAKSKEFIEIGEAATEQALPQIRAALDLVNSER